MAEPILGQALALQSEFRPDTTQVLTKAVSKIGDVTLKKQIAEAKAAETKAKREQDIMAAIKLKSGKLGVHYVGDAQKLLTQGISEITEATQKGDLAKKVLLEGQYQTALDNLVKENETLDNFKKTKQQGGLIPAPVELGLDMPREQANEYFKKLLVENPEYRLIFDQTPEGYYTFNPIKKIDEASEYGKLINANAREFAVENVERINGKDVVSYKISDSRINDLATLLASDDTYRANALINNKQAVNNEIQSALKANPALTQEEAQEIGIKSYFVKNLQSANQDFSVSNTPKPKSGLSFNFGGGGGALSFDIDGNPTNGVIPIQVDASTTTSGGRKVTKTFDRGVPTGNNYSFNTVEVLNTRGENVIDMETNMPLESKMLQSTKVGDVVAVPIATKDFVGANGVNYKKGQMVDGKVLKTAMEKGLASYEPRVKGIASYTGKVNGEDRVVQKSVLIPAGVVRTGVVSSQSGKNQEFINSLFDKAIKEADELNARGRRGAKTSTPKPKTTGKPAPKVQGQKLSFPEWKKQNPNGTAADYKKYKG
jgi:hypothetical protein